MTPERAQLIREHWKNYRDMARAPLLGCGWFRAPVSKPIPFEVPGPGVEVSEKFEVLEFKLEHGYVDEMPMSRVICEGLEVEIGPRAPRT